ncbi:MerR family transcriptional regulator [Streptomyces sp. NPDC051740]|uniref:MerR family transcriptional regulator n=1 Tax=Streptomyces sp. NPDC051740 TaxID=3365673 RepID=UPI0037AB74D9
MAYSTRMAAALSGATVGQLRTWRQDRGNGPILCPELAARPALYSFRDVLALRAFAHLRQDVSLQMIRKALANLKKIGEAEHLSSYSLVAEVRFPRFT